MNLILIISVHFVFVNLKLLKDLICIHDEYCNVKHLLDKSHCSKEYAKTCQTNKFYNKYGGEQANQLGI